MNTMNRNVLLAIGLLILLGTGAVAQATDVPQGGAQAAAELVSPTGEAIDPRASVIFFYSDACPHCHNQMRWMARVRDEFPGLEIQRFEIQVSNNRENQEYFAQVMAAYGSNAQGWPRTVVGDRVFIGFAPENGGEVYNDQYQAWVGYQNQLRAAFESLGS
jgi:hypothetical protein